MNKRIRRIGLQQVIVALRSQNSQNTESSYRELQNGILVPVGFH
jgi:hypothetical protein